MCKVSVQQEERLGQSHPEQCASQAFQSADKSCSAAGRHSRRNEGQTVAAGPTAKLEQQHSRANGQDAARARSVSPPPSKAGNAQDDIVFALAKLLTHMTCATVAACKPSEGKPSNFASAVAPKVTLSSYAARIRKFFRCSDECFVLCLVYIDRLVKLHPEIQVTELTCHRLLLIGTMVAAKFNDDEYMSNAYFAKVGGIENSELNALEAEFMQLINWRLYVKASDYDWYLNALRKITKLP